MWLLLTIKAVNKDKKAKENFADINAHNIFGLFDGWTDLFFTTSHWYIRDSSRAAERPKT